MPNCTSSGSINPEIPRTPIMEFNSQQELQDCIEKWKKVLFLDDWIIKGVLKERPIFDSNGCECIGTNEFQMVNQSSCITIAIPDDDARERIIKYCAEAILVHEMLHCKYNWTKKDSSSIEYCYFDTLEHQLLEQMARSLIMAKYNLPFSWFQNF